MTINEYFEYLLDSVNLRIDDKERDFIEKKQNGLRDALRRKLNLKDDFLTGSYRRHTIIKPKKEEEKFDIDIFVAFDKKEYGEKELSELRRLVASALLEIKDESTELGITHINDTQRRSVCVEFGNNFQIDVVPAIEVEKDKLYKIFDKRTLKPIKSNPKLHAAVLTEANKRTGGKLVPIIKMMKSWKRDKCDYLKSFHLELLTVEILGNAEIKSYPEGIAKIFIEASVRLQKACLTDPANSDHFIDAYLDDDGTRNDLLRTIVSEEAIAVKAIEWVNKGDDDAAVREWKKIFGPNNNEKYSKTSTTQSGPTVINRVPSKPHGNVRFNYQR